MFILTIIGLLLNLLLAWFLRKTEHYDSGVRPFKLRGITWIIWGIFSLIPILNLLVGGVILIIVIIAFLNCDLWIEVDSNHWLFKKY